jgi:hypothetical protein
MIVKNVKNSNKKHSLEDQKLKYAKKLAASHVKIEGTISGIAYITSTDENKAGEPIKLLEINSATSASGVFPVTFGPTGEIPYYSTLIELTPKEARDLEKKQLKSWPQNWEVGKWLYKKRKYKLKSHK